MVTFAAAAAAPGAVAQAPTGTISGTISDRTNSTPVPAAQVQIVGTTRGALTGSDGKFRITAVPSGPVQLRVTRIGYAAETRTVTVPTNDVATVDLSLAQTQVTLDQVVVQATGGTQREREAGMTIATIAADSVAKAAISTFSDLIAAKAPGVNVQQSTGEVGSGSRIRIRGSNSVSLPNDPLIVVDGIRVTNQAAAVSDGFTLAGGQTPSRIDDLNPDDIETVEVLKGPAASALYGTAASNGVLLITTRKGVPGRARWSLHADWGPVRNASSFPANFGQVGTAQTASGPQRVTNCSLILQGLGQCTRTADSLLEWNPLMSSQFSPFVKNASRTLAGGSVAGGNEATSYYVSGDFDNTHGLYANNFQQRNSARANLHTNASPKVDFAVNAGYFQNRLQLPQNDNNTYSPLASAYLGQPFNDPTTHGYGFLLPEQTNNVITGQNVERVTGGATGNWRPLSWLTITGIGGVDYTNQTDRFFIAPGVIPPPAGVLQSTGEAVSNPFEYWTYTTQLNATADYPLSASIRGTSAIGTQYTNEITRGTEASGFGLVAGTGSVAGSTSNFAVTEVGNRQVVTLGYYAQQQLAWRDKVFLTGALRLDDNSAFGQVYTPAYYPSVSASWVIGEEPWFPRSSAVSSLRLRAAFGVNGQHPGFQQAQTFFNSVTYRSAGGEVPGVVLASVGNPNLKPELSREIEGGFDAGFWHDRINLQVTGYAKTTTDALVAVNLVPSAGGFTVNQGTTIAETITQFRNLGTVTNRGLEILLSANLVATRNARLDFTVTQSLNNNKLVTLGPGIAPIRFGLSSITGEFIQRQESGYPLGGFWQQTYTYADLNHDGIIEPNEITLSPDEHFRGAPYPSQSLSLGPTLSFLRYFRIATLFDNRSVVYTFNATQQFRCSVVNPFTNCQQAYDPRTSLKQQAIVAADAVGSDAGFIQDASFWKWRELSFTATAPQRWLARTPFSVLSVTLAGRNLHTWTKYQGPDPEATFAGQSNFTTTDFFTQPIVRYWTGRIDLTF